MTSLLRCIGVRSQSKSKVKVEPIGALPVRMPSSANVEVPWQSIPYHLAPALHVHSHQGLCNILQHACHPLTSLVQQVPEEQLRASCRAALELAFEKFFIPAYLKLKEEAASHLRAGQAEAYAYSWPQVKATRAELRTSVCIFEMDEKLWNKAYALEANAHNSA